MQGQRTSQKMPEYYIWGIDVLQGDDRACVVDARLGLPVCVYRSRFPMATREGALDARSAL